jgi:N-acetyl-anhydromuramyl-L-alanine amidase AmpD
MRTLYGATPHRIPRIEHGPRADTDFIVVHDMESDSIDGVQHYFETSSPDEVGAHLGIGLHGQLRQWADLDALVYHAKGGNSHGIGIELAGFASLPRWRWIKRRNQRITLAKAIARLCHMYNLGLPTRHQNVKAHAEILAGGHTDPGPNFPWDAMGKLARKFYRKWDN